VGVRPERDKRPLKEGDFTTNAAAQASKPGRGQEGKVQGTRTIGRKGEYQNSPSNKQRRQPGKEMGGKGGGGVLCYPGGEAMNPAYWTAGLRKETIRKNEKNGNAKEQRGF